MATVDEIKIIVRAEVDSAIAKLNQLNTATKNNTKTGTDFAKAVAGYTTGFGLAVQATQKIISGVVNLTKESIQLAMGFETAKISWGVLLGDMEKGERMFSSIQALAKQTPLSFESVEIGARTLKQFGIATENVIPTIKMLGDISMGNAEKLKGLSVVYGQIMSTGRLMGQDLLQLINQGFNPLQVISEKTGETMANLKKRMEQGGISAQEVAGAFKTATSEGGLFYGMMDKTAKSSAGLWSTALDNIKMEMAEFGENLLKVINPALKEFNDYMDWKGGKDLVLDVINGIAKGSDAAGSALAYLDKELRIAQEGYETALKRSGGKGSEELRFYNSRLNLLETQLAQVKELNTAFQKQEKAEEAAAKATEKRAEAAIRVTAAVAAAQAKATNAKGEVVEANKRELEQLYSIQAVVHDIAVTPGYSPFDEEAIAKLDDFDVWLEKWKKERDNMAPDVSDWDKFIEKINETQEAMGNIKTAYQAIMDVVSGYMDLQDNMADAELARMKAAGASEEAIAARKNELQKKDFENQKKLSIASAIVSGAEAAVKALTVGPIAGPILAALIAGTTAAQIQMISQQQYVPMANGGIVKAKPGGTLALIGEAGRDEAVVPLGKGVGGMGVTNIYVSGSVWQTRELEALAVGANRKAARAY